MSTNSVMPTYEGRPISHWLHDIRTLRRTDPERALEVSLGCSRAMVAAAIGNPDNVTEYYLIQTCMCFSAMDDLDGMIEFLEEWFSYGFSPRREDFDYRLHYRLHRAYFAKALKEKRLADAYYHEHRALSYRIMYNSQSIKRRYDGKSPLWSPKEGDHDPAQWRTSSPHLVSKRVNNPSAGIGRDPLLWGDGQPVDEESLHWLGHVPPEIYKKYEANFGVIQEDLEQPGVPATAGPALYVLPDSINELAAEYEKKHEEKNARTGSHRKKSDDDVAKNKQDNPPLTTVPTDKVISENVDAFEDLANDDDDEDLWQIFAQQWTQEHERVQQPKNTPPRSASYRKMNMPLFSQGDENF